MRNNRFLIPAVIGCAVLALVIKTLTGRLAQAKPAPRRASSGTAFEEIDTFISDQTKRLNIP